jgi:3-dehydroquinate synthase II
VTARRVILAPSAGVGLDAFLKEASRLGFNRFLLSAVQLDLAPASAGLVVDRGDRVETVGPDRRELSRLRVSDPTELAEAQRRLVAGESLLIRFEGDRVIPLETLVSVRPPGTELWVEVGRWAELPSALGALEHGADAAVLSIDSPGLLEGLARAVGARSPPGWKWASLPVRSVRPVGLSERVIVDTVGLLAPEEGLLVGSVAAWLPLVLSEARGSAVTRPRPFRVNAGAPHSYTLLEDGETRYLSELEAGDPLLIVGPEGQSRSVRVGRLKIERRPMLLVEFATDSGAATLFVQEAETVRLWTDHGATPVTELVAGNRLQVAALPAARHLGRPVTETIEER